MNKNTIRTRVTVGLLLAGVVAMFAFSAGAAYMLRAQPTAVATVNLSKVLDGMEERAAAERDLETMRASFQTTDKAKLDEFEAQQKQLADIVDRAERTKKLEELELAQLQHAAWQRVKVEQLDIEQSVRFQDLYKKVNAAIADMAKAEGWELVIVDDSSSDFSYNPQAQMPRAIQTKQQIVSRRVLWRDNRIDITDALVQRMNNAFQAAAAKNP